MPRPITATELETESSIFSMNPLSPSVFYGPENSQSSWGLAEGWWTYDAKYKQVQEGARLLILRQNVNLLESLSGFARSESATDNLMEYDVFSAKNDKKDRLKQEVSTLLEIAGQQDWDGADAVALDPKTIALAQKFLDTLPSFVFDLPTPDVSATPHGEIDFDWMPAEEVMLTIGICPTGDITFAGTFNNARLNGKELWTESPPSFALACLERLSAGCGEGPWMYDEI